MALEAFAEWATGMGTSFGLGMYLPLLLHFDADRWRISLLVGGEEAQAIVESVRKEEGNAAAEKKSARMLLLTFMIAAGALTGRHSTVSRLRY